jgi:serine/threonine protein kinase
MEYAIESLDKKIKSSIPLYKKLNLMEQCYKIILTLHKEKFFHIDLKPGQFLLFQYDRIKLSDFGSYYTKPTTVDKTLSQKGGFTPLYKAPEYNFIEKAIKEKGCVMDDFFNLIKKEKEKKDKILEMDKILELMWS